MSIYDRIKSQPLRGMQNQQYGLTEALPPTLLPGETSPSGGLVFPQNQPSSQINLGGGLGGFSMPQIPLETILNGIPNLQGSQFPALPGGTIDFSNLPGAPSTTPEIPLETLLSSAPEINLPEGVDYTNLNPTIFGIQPTFTEEDITNSINQALDFMDKDLVMPDVPNDYVDETVDETVEIADGTVDPTTGFVWNAETGEYVRPGDIDSTFVWNVDTGAWEDPTNSSSGTVADEVSGTTIADGTIDPTTGFVWNGTEYVRPEGIDSTFVWNVDTGAWEPTVAPVMPGAPDPVEEVVSTEVADEVADEVVSTEVGIGTLPQVVLPPAAEEDMDLITGTDAPLTEEEIVTVATPTMTPTTGKDLGLLNQQYNDTFLRFLTQDPVNNQTVAPTTVADSMNADGTSTGMVGTPNLPGTLPDNSVQQLGLGLNNQPNIQQYQQTYSTPADIQFQMQNVFGNGNGFPNNNNINNNQSYNNPYEQYGNLVFPTFGSGVTSLVPTDTMYNLK